MSQNCGQSKGHFGADEGKKSDPLRKRAVNPRRNQNEARDSSNMSESRNGAIFPVTVWFERANGLARD